MIQRFEYFISLINTVYKDLQKVKAIKMESFGLKGCHLMCLFYLGTNEKGLTSGELCEKCREDKAAVSRNLRHLSELGYVKLAEKNGQKYKLRNVLTEKGVEVFERIKSAAIESVAKFGVGLTEKERKDFYSAFGVIVKNFDEYCKNFDDNNAAQFSQ